MDWFGLLVQKEMKYNYFFSEKADGLEEGKHVTQLGGSLEESSVWNYGGREKGFLQSGCVLEGVKLGCVYI